MAKRKPTPETAAEADAVTTEETAAEADASTEVEKAPRQAPVFRVYGNTVLKIGPDAAAITRPKKKAIVDAFHVAEGEPHLTVDVAIGYAVEALKPSLKSKAFQEDPDAYLRSYLSTLIHAGALEVVERGSPAVRQAPAAEAGEEGEGLGDAAEVAEEAAEA